MCGNTSLGDPDWVYLCLRLSKMQRFCWYQASHFNNKKPKAAFPESNWNCYFEAMLLIWCDMIPENWILGRRLTCLALWLVREGMGPGVFFICAYVVCITLTSFTYCAKSLFIQLQTRSCIGCQTNVTTTTPRQLKVGKAQLWITHRRGNSCGLAVGRVWFYLKLFWEGGFSTQIRWRCKKRWPNSNGALMWYQKAISLGKLVLVTHAKAVQLLV